MADLFVACVRVLVGGFVVVLFDSIVYTRTGFSIIRILLG